MNNWLIELAGYEASNPADKMFILTDSNVDRLLPPMEKGVEKIVVPAGETSKSIEELSRIWEFMSRHGATRNSLMVNIGGGVVSDLGGFAAGAFKRGMRHVNIPTTLLAMADAAIGGKTGIDFMGLKNEIGMFKMPEEVIVDPGWLDTLPRPLLRDGMAEVVKSALLGDAGIYGALLRLSPDFGVDDIYDAVTFSADFKKRIVAQDPEEKGVRRILNLGHTAGHAFESLAAATGSPVSHGTAVAHGLLVSLILSARMRGMDAGAPEEYAENFLNRHYAPLPKEALDQTNLIQLMGHDKKNTGTGRINFVLLDGAGLPSPEPAALDADMLRTALDLYMRLSKR